MAGSGVDIHGSRFFQGDCRDVAKGLPAASVDLIITDPPYGIEGDKLDAHYNREESFVVDGYVEVPEAEYGRFTQEWVAEAARLLRPGGSIYVVSGYTHLYDVLGALRDAGLTEVNHIIWKYNFGVYTKRKYVSSHYHILYYTKPGGRPKFDLECRFGANEKNEENGSLNYLDREDVWIVNREYRPGVEKNKNGLPSELIIKMIQYSSDPGDVVADLFLGGGSTAMAAIGLGRRAIGIEKSEAMFAHATGRIAQVEPGSWTARLRRPRLQNLSNQGKVWTDAEVADLARRHDELRAAGHTKAKIIEALGAEFQRGRFSILNRIDRIEGEHAGKKDEQETRAQQKLLV